MARVDLEHGLGGGLEPARAGQQLLELAVHPRIGRDEADRAFGQALGHAHVGHRITERRLHEGDEVVDRLRCRRRRLGAFGKRDQAEIGKALRHRLERLAVEIHARGGPEAVDMIGEQQHLDPARAEALELRRRGEPVEIGPERVIDRGLVVLEAGGIVLERTPFAVRGGRLEACEAE